VTALLSWVAGWTCAPALLLLPWIMAEARAAGPRSRGGLLLFAFAVLCALFSPERELAVVAGLAACAGWVVGGAAPRRWGVGVALGVAALSTFATNSGISAGDPMEREWAFALASPAGGWSLASGVAVRHLLARSYLSATALAAAVGACALAVGQPEIPSAGAAVCVIVGGTLAAAAQAAGLARRVRTRLAGAALLPLAVGWLQGPTAAGPYSHPPELPVREAARIELLVDDAAMLSGLTVLPSGAVVYGEFASGRVWILDPKTGHRRVLATVSLPAVNGTRDNYELGLWGLAADPSGEAVYGIAVHRWDEQSDEPHARSSRVVRVALADGAVETVLSGIPAGPIHAGGALGFGPDGTLFASVGDGLRYGARGDVAATESDAGTILALTGLDGPQARSRVYARGFRNVYGLAFDGSAQLWATENGPHCCDSLVRVEAGGNHGWPPGQADPVPPIWSSGPQRLGPTGLAVLSARYGAYAGDLLFATWHTGALHRVRVVDGEVTEHEILTTVQTRRPDEGPYAFAGAFTGLAVGPDGTVWFSTVNAVGRVTSLVQP